MKKNSKKIIIYTFGILCLIFGSVTATYAQMTGGGGGQVPIQFQNPLEANSVSEVLLSLFGVLINLGAVAVVLAIVYAGFLFVAARGNPEELNKAKRTLFWTIIGSLILLGAEVIATIIQNTIKQL